MKLKILLLLSFLFLTSNFSFAENWVKVDNGELNMHLDADSILENDNGIYYNVKYNENLTKQTVIATMQYKKNKLGIVQKVPHSEYWKSPETYSSNTKKKAKTKEYSSTSGGITPGQQRKVWYLMYQLAGCDKHISPIPIGERLCGIIKKELKIDTISKNPFAWLTYQDGSILIERLKKYVSSAEKKAMRGG